MVKRFGLRILQSLFIVMLIVACAGFLYVEYIKSLDNENLYEELTTFYRNTEIASLVIQGDLLIAGGKDGIVVLNVKTLEEEDLEGCPKLRYIRVVFVDSYERIWIGHESGVTVYENGKFYTYTMEDGLPDNRVYSIGETDSGRLYVGTWNGAIELDVSTGFNQGKVITTEDGLTANIVNVIYCDNKDDVWFGTYLSKEGGISIINKGTVVQKLYMEDGLIHSYITSIIKDSNEKIWVGTGFMEEGGACVFTEVEEGWRLEEDLSKVDGLAGEKVRSLFQDSKGIIWIGSEYDGVTLFTYETHIEDGIVLDILTTEKGLTNNEVKTMAEDESGNIWLGTKTGITRVDKSLMEGKK